MEKQRIGASSTYADTQRQMATRMEAKNVTNVNGKITRLRASDKAGTYEYEVAEVQENLLN